MGPSPDEGFGFCEMDALGAAEDGALFDFGTAALAKGFAGTLRELKDSSKCPGGRVGEGGLTDSVAFKSDGLSFLEDACGKFSEKRPGGGLGFRLVLRSVERPLEVLLPCAGRSLERAGSLR